MIFEGLHDRIGLTPLKYGSGASFMKKVNFSKKTEFPGSDFLTHPPDTYETGPELCSGAENKSLGVFLNARSIWSSPGSHRMET